MSVALAILALVGAALAAGVVVDTLAPARPLVARVGGALALGPVLCGVLVTGLRMAGVAGERRSQR
jgi:hypothetical protein